MLLTLYLKIKKILLFLFTMNESWIFDYLKPNECNTFKLHSFCGFKRWFWNNDKDYSYHRWIQFLSKIKIKAFVFVFGNLLWQCEQKMKTSYWKMYNFLSAWNCGCGGVGSLIINIGFRRWNSDWWYTSQVVVKLLEMAFW